MSIILIDNYDSFSWNLAHLVAQALACDIPQVIRNDQATPEQVFAKAPRLIFLSPGPCTPAEAGISLDLVKQAATRNIPVFGVCLGLQIIASAFGGNIVRATAPVHGKTDTITHQGDQMFDKIPASFQAARYHSLVMDKGCVPQSIVPTAYQEGGGIIMAIRHLDKPICGVLFHPESWASQHGKQLIRNFAIMSGASN